MKSFALAPTDWNSGKQLTQLAILATLGIILLLLAIVWTTVLAGDPKTHFQVNFSHAVVTRPTPGGQGIHHRIQEPNIFPHNEETWLRIGNHIFVVTVVVSRGHMSRDELRNREWTPGFT